MNATENTISKILYEADLAHTSCKENKLYDEYDGEARVIYSRANSEEFENISVARIAEQVLTEWFGIPFEDRMTAEMEAQLNSITF